MPPRRKLAHHRSGRVQTGSSSYPEDPPVSISTVTAWSARSSFQQDFTTLSTTSSKAEFTGSVKACRQRHLSLSGGGAVSCRTVPLKVQPRPNVDRTHFSASARPVQGHSDLPPPGAVSPTAQTLHRHLSVNSVQHEVQQRGRTTIRMHNRRHRGLAAEAVRSSHVPVVCIQTAYHVRARARRRRATYVP